MPFRTYQNYEQGLREPDLRTLLAVIDLGWNANWLLTGEGPERLKDLEAGPAGVSQDLSAADLSMAMQLANRKIAASNKHPTPDQYAAFVLSIYEAVVKGLPEAEVLDFSTGQRISTAAEEEDADGGRQGVGAPDRRSVGRDAGTAGGGKR